MTVNDLIKLLEKYPQNLEVVVDRYSDYIQLDKSNVSITEGIPKDEWVMRCYSSHMFKDKEVLVKKYLYLG